MLIDTDFDCKYCGRRYSNCTCARREGDTHTTEAWMREQMSNERFEAAVARAERQFDELIYTDPAELAKLTEQTQHLVSEVVFTDPQTGGKKGDKLARFDLLPMDALTKVAEHYGKGAQKYDDRNWEKGYPWHLSQAALLRHLAAWMMREDTDPETGSNHLDAVIFHALALRAFQLRGIGTDDRSDGTNHV